MRNVEIETVEKGKSNPRIILIGGSNYLIVAACKKF